MKSFVVGCSRDSRIHRRRVSFIPGGGGGGGLVNFCRGGGGGGGGGGGPLSPPYSTPMLCCIC